MSKSKKKVRKLTDQQYNEYIAALKDDAALYNADGSLLIPEQIDEKQNEKKQGE